MTSYIALCQQADWLCNAMNRPITEPGQRGLYFHGLQRDPPHYYKRLEGREFRNLLYEGEGVFVLKNPLEY